MRFIVDTVVLALLRLPAYPAEAEGGEDGGDPRAALVLQLLLSSLEQPTPNLTHLLCGFDFDSGGWC